MCLTVTLLTSTSIRPRNSQELCQVTSWTCNSIAMSVHAQSSFTSQSALLQELFLVDLMHNVMH